MIAGICDKFVCRPVFNGDSKTVDILAIANRDKMLEMRMDKNLLSVSRTRNSSDIVTCLYVQGQYDDAGYVGIEGVNPTGLDCLFNFDYYKEIGAFTESHEDALNNYLAQMGALKSGTVAEAAELQNAITRLAEKWGTGGYVLYTASSGKYIDPIYGSGASEKDALTNGDQIAKVTANGAYSYAVYSGAAGNERWGVKFLKPVAGVLGGKEVALEAKRATLKALTDKLNEAATANEKASYTEQINTTNAEINQLITESAAVMKECITLALEIGTAEASIAQKQQAMKDADQTLSEALGEMLQEGYYSDETYVPGQEAALYSDAVEMLKVMSRPQVSYALSEIDLKDVEGYEDEVFDLNTAVHIICEDVQIGDYGFVSEVTDVKDEPGQRKVKIETDEMNIGSKTFSSFLNRITDAAQMLKDERTIYKRAEAFSPNGMLYTGKLDGIIDVLKNQLSSVSSNWYTDDRGNLIFESLDGESAMMLCGSGFMVADGKTEDGWNWRTFGTGKGFTADMITAGVLRAGLITILGSEQFFWNSDNIYVIDPENENRQIRIGRYDGTHMGIAYTQDNGKTWQTAIGFDGVHLSAGGSGGTSSEYNELSGRIDDLGNQISNTQASLDLVPDKIRLAVEDVQIGGTNLLLNTGKLVIGNYAFDASGADAQGTVSGNGEGGLMIVCAQQNVRWWLGSVKVTPGQRYAISVRYKISSGTSPIQFQYVYRNSSYAAVVYGGSSATQTTRLEDGWTVLSDVLTVPDNAAIDHVELAVRTGADYALYTVEYQVCRPKFEAGSRATDWTPAPEDGELEVKRLEAELSVQAGKITANATKIETVNQAAANAQSAANAAQNAANGAQGTANNAVTRVTTAEQRISAVEGAITSKVEKADFDALGNKVSANTSAITQTAEAIRSEVASSVSGLQTQIEQTDEQVLILAGRTVGGTNLLRAAEGRIGLSSGVIDRAWEKSAWCQSGIGIVMQPTTAEYINAEYWSPFPVTAGEYTLSFWCWTYGIDVQPTIRCNLYNNDPARDHYFGDIQPGANTPVRYTITFTVDYTQSVWLRFLTWTQFTAGEIYISDAKLERGGAATAWSPHPEEFGAGSSVKINENEVSITTPKYSVDVVSEDGTTTALLINESGATFDVAYARNLAYCYYGPAEITVNPNATGSELAAGGVYRSLGEALDALSGRFIPYGVTINIAGDIYGSASLFNAFGHGITINSDGYTLYGALNFDQTGCAISVNNLTVNRPESSANHHALYAYQCRGFVNLYQCTFIGGTETAVNIAQGTKVWMHECEVRGAYNLIYLWYCSDLQALNLKGGDCTNFLIVNGATARLGGTRPDGSWEEWNQSDVLPADPSALTIDYGTATPTAPTIQTASYAMVNADSYAEGYVNSWDWEYRGDDDDVRQGYTEQVGRIYGCMWFDNAAIRSAVAGKTVNQASLRLTAQKYVGRGVAVSVHLWGTATEYAGRSGRPAATADYGIIGTATPGETVTITIPAQAAADLANGTTNGLMLLSDDTALYKDRNYSENYMRFDGETSGDANTRPVLTVVYQ